MPRPGGHRRKNTARGMRAVSPHGNTTGAVGNLFEDAALWIGCV